jgi:hypothetical protein
MNHEPNEGDKDRIKPKHEEIIFVQAVESLTPHLVNL